MYTEDTLQLDTRLHTAGRFGLGLFTLALGAALASTPSSGTLTDASPTLTYTAGPFAVPNVTDNVSGTPTCDNTVPAEQCDTFNLSVNVAASDASTKRIKVTISFPIAAGEFDVFVFDAKGNLLGSDTAGGEPSVATIPAVSGAYNVVWIRGIRWGKASQRQSRWRPFRRSRLRRQGSLRATRSTPRRRLPEAPSHPASLPSASIGTRMSHLSNMAR